MLRHAGDGAGKPSEHSGGLTHRIRQTVRRPLKAAAQYVLERAFFGLDHPYRLAGVMRRFIGTHTSAYRDICGFLDPAYYPERTLDEIVREVALKHGFREDDLAIDASTPEKRYFQQNSESDWDFLSRLALDEGFELYVELGRLHFRKPATRPDRVPGTFVYRENLLSFEPALTVDEAVSRVIVRGWDDQAKRAFQVEVDDPFAAERDVLGQQPASDFLSEAYGESVRILHDVVAQSEAHARAIAMAYFRRKEFELITATGACVGDPELLAKRLIRVGGVGEKFSGDYYLTRVTHKFDDSGYLCDFEAQRNAISRIGTEDLKDVPALEDLGFGLRKE